MFGINGGLMAENRVQGIEDAATERMIAVFFDEIWDICSSHIGNRL